MPKVLMLTGDAAESLEVMYPYQRLLEAGYDVEIAAPSRKKLQFVVHDFVDGRAPEYIRNDPDVQRIIRHFFEAEKPVAQLCHAPLALAAAGVLEGRRTAAYPALEPDVHAAGAEFVDGAAIVDGVMVSARAWPDHPDWMREFMSLLAERAPAEGAEQAVTA